jgi:butyryl-CoA:acetate CoA-transferase
MNFDIVNQYRKKLVSADEAVRVVKSGDWVEYGFGVCGANELDEALARRKDELRDVNIRCDIGAWPHYTNEADPTGEHFYWNSWHFGGLDRKYYQQGVLSYIPMKFHELPKMTRDDCKPTSVFMIMVSPMDRHGFFSFGAGAPSSWAAMETADYVIVEVNRNMPRVLGGNQESIHISQVDYVVEGKNPPLPSLPEANPTDTEKKIAEHIIANIYDGCCIQLGIGGIPNMVGKLIAQSDLKDLGAHTEMVVDAYVDMIESGRVNGRRKEIDRGRVAYTFAIGSQRLYDHLHNNPAYASFPVGYTNDPRTISRISNMVSICNAVQIDLFSQVNAESFKGSQISGNGGMWDFVLGATWSPGGKSFLCMPSTYVEKDGKLRSRIIPALSIGSITTIPRQMVDYIVTEYGAVKLAGNPTWMRAEKIIEIAHPDFRDALIREADNFKIWRRSNKKVNVA